MLETLLLVVFVSIASIVPGLLFLLYLNRSPIFAVNERSLVLSFFLGLSVISLLSAWLTLFLPLHFYTLLPFLLISAIIIYNKRKSLQWRSDFSFSKNKLEVAFFIIACLLFIQLGSLDPYAADTKTYHLQIIRWSQQYKTVPGLANLGPRFSFPSNWFHLISSFSFSPNQGNLQYLNTALSIWFTFYLLIKINENRRKLTYKEHQLFTCVYIFLFLFMTIGWNLLRGNCRSLGNDFIVTTLTLYVLLNIAERLIIKHQEQIDINVLILLAISIPFYKLSGSFISILLLIFLIQSRQPLNVFGYASLLLILFAIPFLAKNYIQTGYPLYPYTFLDLFSPDWKLPPILMDRFMSFNYLSNKYIYQGVSDAAWHNPPFNWLDSWFYRMAAYDQVLIVLFLISLLLFLLKSNHQNPNFKRIAIYLFCTLPILVAWFMLSPDPRFIYAYILFTTFFLLAFSILPFISEAILRWGYTFLVTAILVFFLYKVVNFKGAVFDTYSPVKPEHTKQLINNKEFNIPIIQSTSIPPYCSDISIPCIYQYNPYLEMRGNSFSDGFKMKQTIDSNFIKAYIF